MSKDTTFIPVFMCDIHHDNFAQALCHHHKKLLCLSCVFEKAKNPECSFIEIGKVSGEKDTLLLKCLSVRQIAAKKERLIVEHENKTSILKDKLKQEVTEMHGKLTKRLDEMKEKCLNSIEQQTKSITAANELNKQRLVTIKTAINDHMDKLSAEPVEDEIKIRNKLDEVTTEVMKNIPDKDSIPEGNFIPNKRLSELILQSGATFGIASLIDPEHYDKIDDVTVDERDRTSKSGLYSASDEVVYDTKKDILVSADPDVKTKTIDSLNESTENPAVGEKGKQITNIPEKSDTTSPDGKSERKRVGLWKWFSSDKKKADHSDEQEKKKGTDKNDDQRKSTAVKKRTSAEPDRKDAEKIYQESTFYSSSYTLPKYLINKTANASDLKQHFTSACKFSKLVDLGDGYIGMLSEIHNSLVLVGTGGQVYSKKMFKEGKHTFAAVGNREVAVITEPGLQVTKYKASDKGFTTAAGFIVNEEISNITGFDYDEALLKFAVSSPVKVIVLDKRGKKLKSVHYESTKTPTASDIATTYDFSNDCLYIMNIKDKTLKMLSLEKSNAVWKRRFEFTPRIMCLHKDKLCISCGDAIAIFSATSGKPIVKHDTQDILDDCFGICVIDEAIVFSSSSDIFEKSTTLGYISM